VGDWRDGQQTGIGIITMPNGVIYEGSFRHNLFHGRGIMQFPDGKRLTANYVKGNRKGPAKMEWPCGDVWEGRFESHNISIGLRRFADTGDTLEGVLLGVELDYGSLIVYTKHHPDGKREAMCGVWKDEQFIAAEEGKRGASIEKHFSKTTSNATRNENHSSFASTT